MFKQKSKETYAILKLFKVVDYEHSLKFKTKECYSVALKYLESCNGKLPDRYSFNYQLKNWKKQSTFEKNIQKIPSEKIQIINFSYEKSQSSFSLVNHCIGSPKTESAIKIELAIPLSTFKLPSSIRQTAIPYDEHSYKWVAPELHHYFH